ncbi:MAG TPA: prepilin-type N-terminal cleavage/methylation domain-containing protein [Solirubrobacteraceae bacterium]|jgi:Tfp pilus assembly protein PilW|nr:prepilin-type N-terminal cleavage/methylation domain-containing protein [Solirubrobacteraceae bacterium]
MTTIDRNPAHEDGFSLVELLVAMTIGMIVLFAALQSLDLFSSNAAQQSRATDANDQVRRTMDHTVDDLRGASVILRASANDLVYAVPITTGTRVQRVCVSAGNLYASQTTTTGTPVAPTAACSAGGKVATLPSTSSTAFTYDGAASAANPALVKNVGITLGLDTSGGGHTGSSTLQASAARRSAASLPIPSGGGFTATCNSNGALLDLSASLPGTGPYTVTYADTGGISLGAPNGTKLQIPEGLTTVVATITDAAGLTNTVRKDVKCGN